MIWFLYSTFYFDLELYFRYTYLYLDRDREITPHLTLPTQWISKVFLTHGISVRDVFSWLFPEREALQIWLWNQAKKLYNNIHRMKWKERIMFNIKRAGKPRVAFTILYFRKSLFETTTNSKIVVNNVHDWNDDLKME